MKKVVSQFFVRLAIIGGLAVPLLSDAKPIRASNDPVKDEPPITEKDREHWSFRPLLSPEPPQVKASDRVANDIDRFVLQRLEAKNLQLAAPADAATLIRRLSFDLIGLPPTPDEVKAFEAGSTTDPRAYEALVDRLLSMDQYGEHWAQQWLDLARFAETDGFEHDLDRKQSWQFRDWVIKALNADLPYDDFVAMQIAGDELPGGDAVATGFLLAGPDMPDTNFQDERMHLLLNGIASTVGSAFLGITIGCAQCHDHPYDPISQADFYRLRACFDNVPKLKRDKQLGPTFVESGKTVPVSKVCIRGDHHRPGPVIPAGYPRIANPAGIEVYSVESSKSTGRRAALARWITQPTNALFLRSSANRLWMNHFGKPLVGSPTDLGNQGDKPTHPELLDWLAARLPRERWSLKAMHKLIVMSATYRQAGDVQGVPLATEAAAERTMLYAHFPRRRLTGEQLRDAMLMAAGRINWKQGGEGVRLPLPPEVSKTLLEKQISVTPDVAEHDRRSVYAFARRNLRYPLFDVFDRPDALMSCGRRSESTTAPQSLMLFNSAFSLSMATSLADVVTTIAGTEPESVVQAAIWRCYGRAPQPQELMMGRDFLEKQTALTGTWREALTDYCLALLNANAFCYVD